MRELAYHQNLIVDGDTAEKIRAAINWKEGDSESLRLDQNQVITNTVRFKNGYEADIKCCGVCYEDSEYPDHNAAWTEAVLFTPVGHEVSFNDPSDEYFGKWVLSI